MICLKNIKSTNIKLNLSLVFVRIVNVTKEILATNAFIEFYIFIVIRRIIFR